MKIRSQDIFEHKTTGVVFRNRVGEKVMLELHLLEPNKMELHNVEDSTMQLAEDEVRIKLIYGGICGSDLSVFRGKIPYASYPVRPGHELLGKVVAAGELASDLLGARVVVLPNTFCGECEYCQRGQTNICKNKRSMGVNIDGGFSEEVTVSSKYVIQIPDGVSDERAVLVEPLAVVVHALKKVKIDNNTSIAIVGCGNEGMFAAALASSMGANVTAIDINSTKLERAKSLGVNRAVHPDDLDSETYDVVVEAAGAKQSVEKAVTLVRPGGTCILVGITQVATLPMIQIVRSEITLSGSIIYNFPTDFEEAINHLKKKTFKAEQIISKIVPFNEFQNAYANAISGDFGKIILDFG